MKILNWVPRGLCRVTCTDAEAALESDRSLPLALTYRPQTSRTTGHSPGPELSEPDGAQGGAQWGGAHRLSGNAGPQPPVLRFGQACGLGFHTDFGDPPHPRHSVMPTASSIPVLVPGPVSILQGRCQPHRWPSHGSEAPLPTPQSWGICKGLPWKSHPPQTQLQRWAGQETLAKPAGDQTLEPAVSNQHVSSGGTCPLPGPQSQGLDVLVKNKTLEVHHPSRRRESSTIHPHRNPRSPGAGARAGDDTAFAFTPKGLLKSCRF